MEEYQALWDTVKEKFKEMVTPDIYSNVLETTKVAKIQNGNLNIYCDTAYQKSKLNRLYFNTLNQILADLTPDRIRLKFVSEEDITTQVEKETKTFEPIFQSNLNPSYTFESFVVGESNKVAYRVASQLADPAHGVYVANPLYIFGGVGLGKTHLLQAIGNAILDNDSTKKVLYIAATDFVDDYLKACKKDQFDEFHDKYETVDALLVDDIQQLADAHKSQNEFFKLFNKLHEKNKMIVITADKPADQIKGIMDRLTTRFNWGMSVNITTPDLDHRIMILKRKLSETQETIIPDDVLKYIASIYTNNVRELESTLNRVIYYSVVEEVDVDLTFAKKALAPLLENRKNSGDKDDYENLQSIVSDFYGITVAELTGTKRQSKYILPRHICMYILKKKYDLPYKKIGQIMGGKDHTTVIAAVEKIENEMQVDEQLKMAVDRIIKKID